jgi:hypothetical protein
MTNRVSVRQMGIPEVTRCAALSVKWHAVKGDSKHGYHHMNRDYCSAGEVGAELQHELIMAPDTWEKLSGAFDGSGRHVAQIHFTFHR